MSRERDGSGDRFTDVAQSRSVNRSAVGCDEGGVQPAQAIKREGESDAALVQRLASDQPGDALERLYDRF